MNLDGKTKHQLRRMLAHRDRAISRLRFSMRVHSPSAWRDYRKLDAERRAIRERIKAH